MIHSERMREGKFYSQGNRREERVEYKEEGLPVGSSLDIAPDQEISTPKRQVLLLSPSALIQIGASPHSRRYSSIRKIDFARGIAPSVRRLNFTDTR